jgi:hypothetical protein
MMPKQKFHVIESPNIQELNIKLRDFYLRGYVPYNELKVIFYGQQRDFEKVFIQTLVYNRTWSDFLLRRDL